MAKSKTTELRELETVEVSLVDKGANKRTFAIKKSERKEMKVIDAILSTPYENEAVLLEACKKAELSEQAMEGVKSAIQILSAFQEEVPGNLMKELLELGGLGKQEEGEEEEEATPAEEPTEEEAEKQEEEEDEEGLEKRLSKLPKNVRGMVEQLWKSNKTALMKAEKLEAKVKKQEDEKRLGECMVVAKTFSSLPVKTEKLGAFIKSLDGTKEADFVMGLLKSTNELIAKDSGITEEIGKSTVGGGLDAIAKAERMADAMVEKDGVTKERALATVWKSNPRLYADYQQEKGR
ncbi:hypothetical protein CMI37_18110 [Candidatus Pacearchaeota archaeon]|nr:hypothetical protein [Candidatus Pacearchaeota archaeon]|tara:strand:+ start:607 stop:1485 length:879 start_codon:yes stop_codon:yes gene_type:complete